MSTEYGLRKLVLINSANYEIAEIPLEDSVSIIGPNNSGKTSLINSLQYLLIRDKKQMDFGAYDLNTSAKFYFPSSSSYILLEMLTRNGNIVVGCVGKGISNEYTYFSYQGILKADYFRDYDGSIIEESVLKEKFREKGISINVYPRPTEFFNSLYGKNDLASVELDIRLFSITSATLKNVFQKILVKTLHLDLLDAADVKQFMLQINNAKYLKEVDSKPYDFKKEWDDAFHSVEEDEAQYNACKNDLPAIQELKKNYSRTLELRGKIGTMLPFLNEGLEKWESYKNNELNRYSLLMEEIKGEATDLQARHDQLIVRQSLISNRQDQLKGVKAEYETLQNRFQLLNDNSELQRKKDYWEKKVVEQKSLIDSVKGRNLTYVQKQISELTQSIEELENELHDGEKLFKRKMQALLSKEEMDVLYGLLNRRIFSFDANTLGDVESFAKKFKDHLSKFDNVIEINGLKVERDRVKIPYQEPTKEELEREIVQKKRDLENWKSQETAIKDQVEAQRKLSEFQGNFYIAQGELNDFDHYIELRQSEAERNEEECSLGDEYQANEKELGNIGGLQEKNRDRLTEINNKQTELLDDDTEINNAKANRKDLLLFSNVLELKFVPYIYDGDIMKELRDKLNQQENDCNDLLKLSSIVKSTLQELSRHGFTKFLGIEDADEQIEKTIEFANTLDKEEIAIRNNRHVAITRVGSILKELEQQFEKFSSDLDTFNRLINKRPFSDLKKLTIGLETQDLLEAVKTIAKHSSDTSDSLDLFNPQTKEGLAGNKEIDNAKSILFNFCSQYGSLRLENLFNLSFRVQKEGRPEQSFSDLSKIGSNGTVLMAKLIFGLALLSQMTEKRNRISSICYLDEAASIDETNQKNLIEAAKEFGFNLLFASPTAQTTAHYCIRIEKRNNMNVVTDKQWIRLEKKV